MNLNRRNLLQSVGLGSLGSFWPLSKLAAARPGANIYQQLGVRPVINCMGAQTVIGASRQRPELHAPMADASSQFVFLEELQEKIGERLSKLIGSEAAMVTTGAAGAITLGTCASLTGSGEEKIRRLPDLTGMKSEVLIHKRHRNNFDHAIPGIDLGYTPDLKSHKVQRVLVQWDEQKMGLTTDEFERQLLAGEPRIAALHHPPQGMTFVFFLGEPGDENLVARRLKEIFTATRRG